MKKFLVFSLMVGCLAGVFAAEAASVPEPKVQAKAFGNYNDPDTPQPLDKWTFLQIVFLPNVPNSTWNSNVYGLKTGWTVASGYNLVATAKRKGVRLVAVVMGGTSSGRRDLAARRLLEAGFASPDSPRNVERSLSRRSKRR